MKILSFNGIYLSKSLQSRFIKEHAKDALQSYIEKGIVDKFEKKGEDILIEPGNSSDEFIIRFVPYDPNRVNDENYI